MTGLVRPLQSNDGVVLDDEGFIVGIKPASDRENRFAAFARPTSNSYALMTPDGGVFSLAEAQPVAALTATGTAQTGAGFYRGVKVRAISGGPQTLVVYDATSATGTPIDTIIVNDLGTWLWDRPSDVLPGVGARRSITTGVHVVITGGTSRTIDVMVEPT